MKNKHYISFGIIALLVTFLSACNSANSEKTTDVSFREEWFPSACFAGDMMAANETAKDYNINIKVESGAEDIDPVKLVIAGTNDLGVAGGDRVITANNTGADLVILAAINYKSPTCFIALKNKNILAPKDFENKIIGVMTGNNTEYVYRSLVNKAALDGKKINEVEAPFDLATFITGSYDVRPAFVYDEPVSLDLQNISYTTIKPEDFGVNFIGPVIFAKRSYVEKNKELVQKFINAMCKGWQSALQNPDKAIGYLKTYDKNIDNDRELKSLIKGKEYFAGEDGKPLFLSKQRWDLFVDELVNLKLVPKSDKNSSCFDGSFVSNYYDNIK
jgi:NitT/TauT family transport system substrate-binding protein